MKKNDEMPLEYKLLLKEMNLHIRESKALQCELESFFENDGVNIAHLLSSGEVPNDEQTDALMNIYKGNVSEKNLQLEIDKIESIYLTYAKKD